MKYTIYTRGCYDYAHDAQVGAGAYVMIVDGGVKGSDCFKVEQTSHLAAELKAIIGALGQVPCESEVEFVTDTDYIPGAVMNTQSRNTNLELLAKSDKLIKEKYLSVTFRRTDTPVDKETSDMAREMCNDVVGYDINAKYSKYKKESKEPTAKKRVPTISGGSIFTSIYPQKSALKEDEKQILRGKLNTLIREAQDILALL